MQTLKLDLPEPDAEAQAHSLALQDHMVAVAKAMGGRLSFDHFMELALYAPGLGYYSAGLRKFGAAGDFITSPEVSPLFAYSLANQCAEILAQLGGGDILEFGAGSGALACDLLQALDRLDRLPERYLILELSADLRQRQQRRIGELPEHLAARVAWLERLPEQPIEGVMLANEVLDAMPVALLEKTDEGWLERGLAWDEGGWAWEHQPLRAELSDRVAALDQAYPGIQAPYRTEICLAGGDWVALLFQHMSRGAALLIDYGYSGADYYRPDRGEGTLSCHYRHRVHAEPRFWPGLQDITAFVDFSHVAEAAHGAGWQVAGFAAQAQFLMGCGITEWLAEFTDPDDLEGQLALAQQVKTLTLPGEMGERFKVLGLTKDCDQLLRGFAMQDLRGRL